jgi:ATP-binding cassette, subfamily F, member 3
LDKLEATMQGKTAERDSIQTSLLTMTKPLEMTDAGKKLNAIEKELADLEEKWLELSEQMESTAS